MRKEGAGVIFHANISHELRTPLNVIIGMCDVARRHIDDREKVEECLIKIGLAGEHMAQLINNILDINRIEQGKLCIAEERFHIDGLMGELQVLLEPLALDKSLVLEIDAKEMVNKEMTGDYGHVMQIMINLATNAIKYTPQGGFVKLRVEERPNEKEDVIGCRFLCQDNGIGMTEEFQAHVFEPFSRSDDARIQKVSGAGLGMSIVREIVDVLGGTIHIDSALDMGTTITVDLDFRIAPGHEKITDIEAYKRCRRERIKDRKAVLVAEKAGGGKRLAEILTGMGMEADRAENGEQVVDMFMESEEGFYKAVFMDIEMPVMDGYQAAMMIRGLNRTDSDVPVIAMGSGDDGAGETAAGQAGISDYLTKPLQMDRLKEMLKTWITESVAR